LVDLTNSPEEKDRLREHGNTLRSITLSPRSVFDLELLSTGAFSPLDRFMGEADYHAVVNSLRLADGTVFPIPISLPVDPGEIGDAAEIALRDQKQNLLAVMSVEELYAWRLDDYCQQVLGTLDDRHPLVSESRIWNSYNVSGRIRMIDLPKYYDFPEIRLSPKEVRGRLEDKGLSDVGAFQTRNPLHRVHEELIRRALAETQASLLLHPVVGLTKPGDVDQYQRVRSYKVLVEKYFDTSPTVLALLPLAMRMAGPREALWHAIIRRNYGANHLIVGRDHASPGSDSNGTPFYHPYAAQELVEQYSDDIGVKMIPFRELVYSSELEGFVELSAEEDRDRSVSVSGTAVRSDLRKGDDLPDWLTRPEIARILAEAEPPLHRRGFCIWFTGLSGAGKSATAEILTVMLMARGRKVTLLDGDIVRTNLSAGLGFDRDGRDANVRRIGWVAGEIVRHGGAAVCAAISPYIATRAEVRTMIGTDQFVEVFMNTPLEVCEARDTKGLYAKARSGKLAAFTGVHDVYEAPESPELMLETELKSAEDNANHIIAYLESAGYLQT
jgi:sulfate adenylyltransferase